MTSAAPYDQTHFRAQSRKPVSLLGAMRPAAIDVIWNRDVRVIDLGLGGACVETADPIPTGTAIELVIDTPHLWEPLTLSGAVAWSLELEEGGARIGIRFHHTHGGSVRKLTEFLEAEAFS
jgi:hypothetical protein